MSAIPVRRSGWPNRRQPPEMRRRTRTAPTTGWRAARREGPVVRDEAGVGVEELGGPGAVAGEDGAEELAKALGRRRSTAAGRSVDGGPDLATCPGGELAAGCLGLAEGGADHGVGLAEDLTQEERHALARAQPVEEDEEAHGTRAGQHGGLLGGGRVATASGSQGPK